MSTKKLGFLTLILLVLLVATVLALPVKAASGADSFFVLGPGIDDPPIIAGVPFRIAIFSYDANGNQIFNAYGNLSLTVSSGTVNPSTVGPFHEGAIIQNVTITGTNSTVITVSDDAGHKGSRELIISSPVPTASPTSTPSISPTEMPNQNQGLPNLMTIAVIVSAVVLIIVGLAVVFLKTHNKNQKPTLNSD